MTLHVRAPKPCLWLVVGTVTATATTAACNRGLSSSFEGEIRLRTTRAGAAAPVVSVFKVKAGKMRIEIPAADGKPVSAIYLPAENRLLVLADAQKTATEKDLGSPIAPVADANQRAAAVESTGKHETIEGIDCEDVVVTDRGGARTEACIAHGLPFLGLDEVRGDAQTSQWSRDMRANRTFPLRSVDYDQSGKELVRTEVVGVRKETLDDALFQVPAGYTRVARAH